MAKFVMELPDDIQKDINYISHHFEDIFGGMTRAGAEEVRQRVLANMPSAIREGGMANNVSTTRTYKTPSDDGINTKVIISGYFTNKNGEKTPAPLVANMFEYGSTTREYPKHPFFRRSFNKQAVMKVMLEEQKRLSKGILDE